MFQPLDKADSATVAETVEEVVEILYRDLSLRDRVSSPNSQKSKWIQMFTWLWLK